MLSVLEMIVSLFLWSLVSMGIASSLPRQADMRLINPLPNNIIINKANNTLVLVFILRLSFNLYRRALITRQDLSWYYTLIVLIAYCIIWIIKFTPNKINPS